FYYRTFREQLYQRYRSRVPLPLRLLRSAWLSYDLMQEDRILLERATIASSQSKVAHHLTSNHQPFAPDGAASSRVEALVSTPLAELRAFLNLGENEIIEKLGMPGMVAALADALADIQRDEERRRSGESLTLEAPSAERDDIDQQELLDQIRSLMKQ